jgi:hypothetical protein
MLAVQGGEAEEGEREVIHGRHPLRDVPTLLPSCPIGQPDSLADRLGFRQLVQWGGLGLKRILTRKAWRSP